MVPAERVPAVTALAILVCKVPIVSPACAVNSNVSPVVASPIVVIEPAVSSVAADKGAAAELFAELYSVPEAADIEPRTASFELTTIPAALEFVAIES